MSTIFLNETIFIMNFILIYCLIYNFDKLYIDMHNFFLTFIIVNLQDSEIGNILANMSNHLYDKADSIYLHPNGTIIHHKNM